MREAVLSVIVQAEPGQEKNAADYLRRARNVEQERAPRA
jgi:hypothetical protein